MMRLFRYLALLSLLVLSACGDNGVSELKEWMNQVKKDTPARITPIKEPKTYIPVAYQSGSQIDPFDPAKLLIIFARMKAANDNGLKPDFDRPKEALEAFPLESMRMSGTVDNGKVLQGLVSVGKTLYTVSVGAYVGQNFGKIVSINDTRIDFVERIQDLASGEWAERKASLELQEAKK
ncbi:MAG: pilus assembly protein PilP [Undibacterium sp.]|nr:pilus assembly protein PilP [Undibacterium sp.]